MGQTYQSVLINAPVDKVWARVRDFHDMSWAPDIITSIEVLGERKGDEPGARRIINGMFHETLCELSDAERSFRYRIDDGPSPVSRADVKNYFGQVSVRPVTGCGNTFVEWSSSWELNDKAAARFCHAIHVALLVALKQRLETCARSLRHGGGGT